MVAIELKDDVEWQTYDLLRDPVIAAQHLDLQYVQFVALVATLHVSNGSVLTQ